jgi:ribosomal protein S1
MSDPTTPEQLPTESISIDAPADTVVEAMLPDATVDDSPETSAPAEAVPLVAPTVDAVVEAAVEAPVETPDSTTVEAAAEAVVEAPVETPDSTTVEAAAEAVVEAAIQPTVEEDAEVVVEAAPAAPEIEAVPPTDEGGTLAYQPGDIVPATVTAVRDDGIDVELDGARTAVAPKAEWLPGSTFAVGDVIEGQVLRRQGAGRYVISMKRAHKTRSWTRILAARDSGEVMSGKITESVKGGLIVDLGLRAFLPESLIDVRRVAKPAELIGQTVNVLVIEAEKSTDRPGERIVVSRKPLREKERASERSQLIHQIQVGDRRRGRVSAIVPFGAFVDLGGIDGLIHVSELAHSQVASADKVLSVGEEVDVVVLEVNPEKRKIALSRKRALPDPWSAFQGQHQVGDLVFGTITGLAPFGAFVAIEGAELEGLIHISELSRFRVEQASDVVSVGEGVWVQVLEIAPEKRRLALSLRRALE